MNRWTIKEMNSLNSFDFAKAIMIERRGNLNAYSPFYAKLSEAAVEIGAAGERERKCFKCESESLPIITAACAASPASTKPSRWSLWALDVRTP